jgi:hypothetical protein
VLLNAKQRPAPASCRRAAGENTDIQTKVFGGRDRFMCLRRWAARGPIPPTIGQRRKAVLLNAKRRPAPASCRRAAGENTGTPDKVFGGRTDPLGWTGSRAPLPPLRTEKPGKGRTKMYRFSDPLPVIHRGQAATRRSRDKTIL